MAEITWGYKNFSPKVEHRISLSGVQEFTILYFNLLSHLLQITDEKHLERFGERKMLSHSVDEIQDGCSYVEKDDTELRATIMDNCRKTNIGSSSKSSSDMGKLYMCIRNAHSMGVSMLHTCFVCKSRFPNFRKLQEHVRKHNSETPYGCGTCSCQYRTASDLKRHVENAHGTSTCRSYKCSICDWTYKTFSTLVSHMRTHASGNPNICKICCRPFKMPSALKVHIKVCHLTNDKNVCCEKCPRRFANETYLKHHRRFVHPKGNPVSCNVCSREFKNRHYLSSHMKRHGRTKSYECNQCGSKFSGKQDLKIHTSVHSSGKDFRCDLCNRCFKYASTVQTHIKRKHTPRVANDLYTCNICFKQLKNQQNLRRHLQIHTGEGRLACHVCNKEFRPDQLKRHMKAHTDIYQYECSECSKKFRWISSLNYHVIRAHTTEGRRNTLICDLCNRCYPTRKSIVIHTVSHLGQRKYQCCVCDKQFFHQSNCRNHEMLHFSEPKLSCNHCAKSFKDNKNFQSHIKIHMGKEHSILCDICNKSFTQLGTLMTHVSKHLGLHKRYECEICYKLFNSKPSLRTHGRIHSGDKPFKCETCMRCFSVKSSLTRHVRLHTGAMPYKRRRYEAEGEVGYPVNWLKPSPVILYY